VCTLAEHQPRPPFIKHYSEIKQPDNSHYSGSDELHSIGSPFGRVFGLQRLGIHHELLPPGRRTSYPHAESMEEEFVYVIEGNPDAWINGHLHRLAPGDGVASQPAPGSATPSSIIRTTLCACSSSAKRAGPTTASTIH
jgi:uncharacterized cupin superfamily protein